MKPSRWLILGIALACALRPGASEAAQPGKNPELVNVPGQAPIVVHVRGIDRTVDRLVAFLKNAVPNQAAVAEAAIKGMVASGFDGREFKGLAKEGRIFLAVLEIPDGQEEAPRAAVIAQVDDYGAFRDGLLKEDERKGVEKKEGYEAVKLENGMPLFFVQKDKFAVLTPSEEVAKGFTKEVDGLGNKLSAAQAEKFLAGDLSVYVNTQSLSKAYSEQIKELKETLKDAIKSGGEAADPGTQAQLKAAGDLIDPLFKAIDDSRDTVLSLRFEPEGIALHSTCEIREDTETHKAMGAFQTANFEELGKLPAGMMFYTASKMTPGIFQFMNKMVYSSAKGSDSPEAKQVAAALEEMGKAGPGVRVDAMGLPMAGVQVNTYSNPKQAVAAQLKLIQGLEDGAAFQSGVIKGKPVITTSAKRYGDFDLHQVKIAWDLEKMAAGFSGDMALPEETVKQMQEMMKKLLGESTSIWFGTDGKVMVQATAPSWEEAEKLLDQYTKGKGTVGEVAEFKEARKSLPEESSMLVLVDLPRYLTVVFEMMKPIFGGFLPVPPNYPAKLPADSASYVGFSAGIKDNKVSFDGIIRASTINNAYKAFVVPFLQGDL